MTCLHFNINSDGGSCADCGLCMHEVVFGGLCALCGAVVDQNEDNDYTSNHIDMTHDASGITVSKKEAERIQKQDEARLLTARKLSLIVDLDQTILHAAWEPHIAEWVDKHKQQGDSRAEDMSTFTLDGSKYTIKLRPGTIRFLKDMSKLYEMHVYTMGTRAYAKAITAVIDPSMELFQDRILTRDENGSLTKKRLDRLFPADQSKVVVLDDRADVWDYSPNLIQIKPYEYFAGVGDINAPPNAQSTNLIPTELMKGDVNTADVNNNEQVESNEAQTIVNNTQVEQKDSISTVNKSTAKNQRDDGNSSESSSGSSSDESDDEDEHATTEKAASTSLDHDKESTKEESATRLNNQQGNPNGVELESSGTPSQVSVKDRPNDAGLEASADKLSKDESHDTEPQNSNIRSQEINDITPSPDIEVSSQDKPPNSILTSFNPQHEDTDRILDVINKTLTDVHDEFYRLVDKNEPEPHVANVLPEIKRKVLKDCTLVFSGVIPLQQRTQDATIWKMAAAFGANCLEDLTGKVTHLVAANAGTSKVNTARRYKQIKIVSPPWLMNSIWNFKKESETQYLIPVEDATSEVENPEEASLEFDVEEKELDMDWEDSEIDELLADDTGTEGNHTPGFPSSVGPESVADIYDLANGNASDAELEELDDADWLGEALDGMDESDQNSDYGDVESVASGSSYVSSSSKKRQRDFDDDQHQQEESELPISKRRHV
ncbi:hypothetical protein [Parasitella parasitica]|uniref:RNA polymerase II subunit A C-terminal domain phosphatase n=1 Tax=Parasitella parasitica TaxID=35722 RepID=A0A0B7N0X2_9FUNG|nr:hypothetical protein [Parasitella parasitica]